MAEYSGDQHYDRYPLYSSFHPLYSSFHPLYSRFLTTIGTHSSSLIGEALAKGFTGFDMELAWEAVLKDATVPPEDDLTTMYFDR